MEKVYRYKMAFGLMLFVGGMLLAALKNSFEPIVAITLLTSGGIIMAFTAYRHARYRDTPREDERTKKLGAYGLSYSWLATLIFVGLLYWIDYLGIHELTVQQTIGSTFFVMIITALAFQRLFFWKGDVS